MIVTRAAILKILDKIFRFIVGQTWTCVGRDTDTTALIFLEKTRSLIDSNFLGIELAVIAVWIPTVSPNAEVFTRLGCKCENTTLYNISLYHCVYSGICGAFIAYSHVSRPI